jgi:dynein heavy chain, axonemal
MQSWPGMCVLNASQLHWTAETEAALGKHAAKGPAVCLTKQLAQLEDMVLLVRGELSKGARTAIGALTGACVVLVLVCSASIITVVVRCYLQC